MEREHVDMNRISPDEARQALADVDEGRQQVARRAAAPWWYHVGIGASLLFAFASVSIGWDWIPYGVIGGLFLGPYLVTQAAKHFTGVSLDRFQATPGARRISLGIGILVPALILVGLVLEWGLDLRGAMAAVGVLVMVLVIVLGRRLDAVLTRELGRPA
ncbi:hypothetical protein [Micromonospora parathelypteridis]|uniref:Uncharacterized protein n=1 Tax=Micromonospora parathelypteridis TaxID=1839617 RepID=A0A840W8I9_9ACTN|nr:hypothetical protein [Micromonospora parathelypteridis]MBB5481338.1 hypothetical protein [Micromonospora parathelypteridis]